LRRPRVILQVSHESKKIKFKHTIRGAIHMKITIYFGSHEDQDVRTMDCHLDGEDTEEIVSVS
ncbi:MULTISPECIES: hypothetical protein, partial [Bacillus cereus group]